MNAAAAAGLYKADADGVKQIFGRESDEAGGRCAVFVIAWTLGHELSDARMRCPLCDEWKSNEVHVIVHLNDEHRLTFSEIARKLGPDSV